MLGQVPQKPFVALHSTQVDFYPDNDQSIIIRFPVTFLHLKVTCSLLKEKSVRASKGHRLFKMQLKAISSPHLTNQICKR